MPDWMVFVVLLVGYIVVMGWLLPKFGVPT